MTLPSWTPEGGDARGLSQRGSLLSDTSNSGSDIDAARVHGGVVDSGKGAGQGPESQVQV